MVIIMELQLEELKKIAGNDPGLRKRLIATRGEKNPINTFCKIAAELGFDQITPYALATVGEVFCAQMLRSVNGGGVHSLDRWDDDYYNDFIDALVKMDST